ncbi:MAG: phenylalanine--tRNA ligase subunit beta [Bacteroidetes bacterium HGW-Bacteroidetes-21]|nr:MAG: phenylalanine--tRNA ligase subunit beta [Bacteroidetes bacterium HGW-Bacteroidetes-21]
MKISYNWLKKYIQTDISVDEASKVLTSIGLEVEGITRLPHEKLDYTDFIIGEVLEVAKHPNADKLRLTKVNIGQANPLSIVCGAPNVAEGQKVIVAPVGCKVVMKDEIITLKKAEIRGEVSEGMLCAEDEIDLGHSHDGIKILDPSAVPGTNLKDFLAMEEDFVLEIGLTPNRIDAASHFGVARDLAAYFQHRKPILLERPSVENFKPDTDKTPYPVIVENPEACVRYSGLLISNITVKESPAWLQTSLKAIGLKPINNIVDITNFILHETGQPLHAFDAAKIKGNKVIVKKVAAGTHFITLDGIDRTLAEDDLMICNETEPMCIAGVFGGIYSGVTNETSSVFLESACFDPRHVRKTAKLHGLNTDASFRFERGADPNITVYVLKRAALLIKELTGGIIEGEITDVYPNPVKPVTTEVSFASINNLIGQPIEKNIIKEILSSIEINIVAEKEKSLLIEIPTYRVDVTREVDIVEEILRIYGYNQIEISDKVHSNLSWQIKPDKRKIENTISDMLVANGFYEMMNNSLTHPGYFEDDAQGMAVKIINPLSNELSVLRRSLTFSGLESVAYNLNRKMNNLKLFEIGNYYSFIGEKDKTGELSNYKEKYGLSLLITGNETNESWHSKPRAMDFSFIRSYTEMILSRAGIDIKKVKTSQTEDRTFSSGIDFKWKNEIIATAGIIGDNILKKMDIRQPVFHAKVELERIIAISVDNKILFREIPKFPEVKRDLSMVLPREVSYSEIEKIAFNSEKKLLKSVNLFDVYEGDKIEKGKKSYAISFILFDSTKTLTNEEIEATMTKLSTAFEKEVSAMIRRG